MGIDSIKTSLMIATGLGLSAFGGFQYLNKYHLDKSWRCCVTTAWVGFGSYISEFGGLLDKPKK